MRIIPRRNRTTRGNDGNRPRTAPAWPGTDAGYVPLDLPAEDPYLLSARPSRQQSAPIPHGFQLRVLDLARAAVRPACQILDTSRAEEQLLREAEFEAAVLQNMQILAVIS